MTFQEIDDFGNYISEKYPDYKTNIDAVKEVRNHPSYSHSVIKQSWEDNYIYFYCEQSPTKSYVLCVFKRQMAEYLFNSIELAIR